MIDLNSSTNIQGFQGDWIIDIPYPLPRIEGPASYVVLDSTMHKELYKTIYNELSQV